MRLPAALVLLVAVVTSCGGGGPSPAGSTGDLTVFAASSLADAFGALSADFKAANPGAHVTFNFAGTPTLLGQLQQGARADVLASADEANMQRASDAGLLASVARIFAHNRLEIVVAPGNPKHIGGLADLGRADVLYITEAPAVPAGRYGAQALAAAGVKVSPRSFETDVKAVVSKVQLGEADAGIVYVTDVRSAGSKVAGVAIPDNQNVLASYPVAVLKGGANPNGARAFVDFLLGAQGQANLERLGFGRL